MKCEVFLSLSVVFFFSSQSLCSFCFLNGNTVFCNKKLAYSYFIS